MNFSFKNNILKRYSLDCLKYLDKKVIESFWIEKLRVVCNMYKSCRLRILYIGNNDFFEYLFCWDGVF